MAGSTWRCFSRLVEPSCRGGLTMGASRSKLSRSKLMKNRVCRGQCQICMQYIFNHLRHVLPGSMDRVDLDERRIPGVLGVVLVEKIAWEEHVMGSYGRNSRWQAVGFCATYLNQQTMIFCYCYILHVLSSLKQAPRFVSKWNITR